tara:strand:- start:2117 stop:3106 length:990 start_codon:yes stop_codon:yes gene_type:complete
MTQSELISLDVTFEDNRLLPLLMGKRDHYLKRIEDALQISISGRGNRLVLSGPAHQVTIAQSALMRLYDRLKKGLVVSNAEVDAAVRLAGAHQKPAGASSFDTHTDYSGLSISTRRHVVSPRSPNQERYIDLLFQKDLVFATGPAGTGKTFLAVATAVAYLLDGKVDRIILSRPAVEAGERLGFLPGDLREKVDPYLRPLYDALHDMLPDDQMARRLESGEIEVAPLAFMRGRTLSRSYIILDEAQNTTEAQMKMFLTRLGEGSRMVVTGDLTQVDLPMGVNSGLRHCLSILQTIDDIGVMRLDKSDVVRHDLVSKIVEAYEARSGRSV